jgi:hypothetical protein
MRKPLWQGQRLRWPQQLCTVLNPLILIFRKRWRSEWQRRIGAPYSKAALVRSYFGSVVHA